MRELIMESFVEKHRGTLLEVTSNIFIMGVVLLLLHHFTNIIVSVWIDTFLLVTVTFTSGFGWFFVYIQKDKEYFKERTEPFFKHSFIVVIVFIIIGSLPLDIVEGNSLLYLFSSFFSSVQFYLILLAMGFSFFIFHFNKERLEEDTELEKKQEEMKEREREEEFDTKFAFSADLKMVNLIFKNWKQKNYVAFAVYTLIYPLIWFVKLSYRSVKWMYKEGIIYTLIFIGILSLFALIKAPYFDYSFTGEHVMKYSTYVEPAKHMYESNNPFLNQRKYLADPTNNPQGIFGSFGSIPLLEWGLAATYIIMPFNSLEENTRLFTLFIGILSLIFAYIFFKKWFSKKQSLIILFGMSINPIINFTYFVTVEDSLLLLFTFISLYYISSYVQENHIKSLFFSGLFFGIGVACKYSIILWVVPIVTVLLIFHKKINVGYMVKSLGIYGILGMLPVIAFKTSLRYLPTNVLCSILLFIMWTITFVLIYKLITIKENFINILISKIVDYKILFFAIITLIIMGGILFLYITKAYYLFDDFLTDYTLLFYWDMYHYMLEEQFKNYMSIPVYYFGLIGVFFSVVFSKNQKIIYYSVLLGALVYWIMASKVIFFHNYYCNIIMMVFILGIAFLISNVTKCYNNKNLEIIFLIMFLLLVFPASYDTNVQLLSQEKDMHYINEATQYLIENTNENEIWIDTDYNQYLTIYSNRPQTRDYRLDRPEVRESIKKIGFVETMNKYNISYIITTRKELPYERYVNFFTDEELSSLSYKRSDLIHSTVGSEEDLVQDTNKRLQLVEKLGVKEKFVLEKEIGPYKFYSFKD